MTQHINKFLAELSDLHGGFAYRGQEDAEWELESSAIRRLKESEVTRYWIQPGRCARTLLRYHLDELIDPARTAGFGIEDGHEIPDLELLAKLQHFGAATGLLDFTWNPLVALWFACKPAKFGHRRIKGGEPAGKVFALNLNDQQHFERVPYRRINENPAFEKLISPEELNVPLYWEPIVNDAARARIIGQSSVFVIGRPFIPSRIVNEFEIDADHKQAIREELTEHLGISDLSLFRDVHGFARTNGVGFPTRVTFNPEKHMDQGTRLHQQQDYAAAVRSFDRCLEQAGEISEILLLRANAKADAGDHKAALRDYEKAENCKDLFLDPSAGDTKRTNELLRKVLFNRGNSKTILEDLPGAAADFYESRRYCPTAYWLVRSTFNLANTRARLRQLQRASEDYEEAIREGGDGFEVPYGHAQFNKGNVLVMLGRLKEARESYTKSLQSSRPNPHAARNLASLEKVIEYVGNSGTEPVEILPDFSTQEPVEEVRIVLKRRRQSHSPVQFAGNVGNIGNTGGADPLERFGLPGSKGLPGGRGFRVAVSCEE